MTKKLAGAAKGTALWVSSVSNEKGQVLNSVLTAQEGPGLDRMVSGLIARYSEAGVAPPILLYVDCGCCKERGGESKLKARFSGWPDLVIRLDIWHFLRRLASGCTTDAHALYPVFMAKLSVCLFEWDPEDVALLRHAKREELRVEGVPGISEAMVDGRLTKSQLALHCRRFFVFMFAVPSAVPPQDMKPKRKYNRTGEANKCRRCGEPRTAATGHSQYKGTIYCPSFESLTKEQWLAERRI